VPFKSQKQWKWAFSQGKAFAHKWAHMRPYKRLPRSKKSGAKKAAKGA
jgi:hypothetical protein